MAATLDQLKKLRQSLPAATPENVNLREDMLVEARRLMMDLERPDNSVERVAFQLLETVSVDTAIQMGLFRALNAAGSSTTTELAKSCNADPVLVGRLLRCLASNGAVEEDGPDKFSANARSKTFGERQNEVAVISCVEFLSNGWLAIPKHLKEKNWQSPNSATDTPMAKGWGKDPSTTLWEMLAASPAKDSFMEYMATFNDGHKEWTDVYPVVERIGAGASTDPDAVLMVDVGGGQGHQAINLKRKYQQQLPGKFVVQDLPFAFPPADKRAPEVEYMEHDFTKEQPVKGARMYYLRYVPHDWSQEFNINLCTQLRKAMKPGYSKLIVNEWIVPEVGATRFMTAQDLNMMTVSGGMERTEPLHREYLEKAGLKITKIFYPDDKISEAVIEAEVA